jgi:hypothetical protein
MYQQPVTCVENMGAAFEVTIILVSTCRSLFSVNNVSLDFATLKI